MIEVNHECDECSAQASRCLCDKHQADWEYKAEQIGHDEGYKEARKEFEQL